MSCETDDTGGSSKTLESEDQAVQISEDPVQDDGGLLIYESINHRQEEAARKIQASWRNHRKYKITSKRDASSPYKNTDYTDDHYLAALIIQNQYRNYTIAKNKKYKEESAAKLIQKYYRTHLQRIEAEFEADLERAAKQAQESYNKLKENQEEADSGENEAMPQVTTSGMPKDENGAALVIQRQYRKHIKIMKARAFFEKQNQAALLIQKQFREYSSKKKNDAALKIQTHFRVQKKKNRESKAAIKIQTQYRAHLKRKNGNKDCNINPNGTLPRHIDQRDDSQNYHCKSLLESRDEVYMPELAALMIQKNYRAHLQKRHSAAKTIQTQFRDYQKRRAQDSLIHSVHRDNAQENIEEQENAAIFIQKHYRSYKEILPVQKLDYQQSALSLNLNETLYDTSKSENCNADFQNALEKYGTCDKFIPFETALDISTNESRSIDDDPTNWNETQINSQPNIKKKYQTYSNVSKIPRLKDQSKQWPESKKSQYSKVKDLPRKKQVQASLEMKREQRRTEKNKKKDCYHLSNLRKQASNVKQPTERKPETGAWRAKKVDTPQPKQVNPPSGRVSELELLNLCESTGDESPTATSGMLVDERKSSPLFENTAISPKSCDQICTSRDPLKNTALRPSDVSCDHVTKEQPPKNLPYSTNDPMETGRTFLARDARGNYNEPRAGRRTAGRMSNEATRIIHQIPFQTKVSLGSLDSYTVQEMLKRNNILTKQKHDNQSYLQSYLKQMNIIKRSPVHNSSSQLITQKVSQYSPRRRQEDPKKRYSDEKCTNTLGSLERIAKYGRNSQPDTWKTFVEESKKPSGKGASRGSFYPVIPAYGKIKPAIPDENQNANELNEIPWPSNIG